MNRIILASVVALGMSGAALAQQAPVVVGDFSANVPSTQTVETGGVHGSDVRATWSDAERGDTMIRAERTDGAVYGLDRTETQSISNTPQSQSVIGGTDDAYNR